MRDEAPNEFWDLTKLRWLAYLAVVSIVCVGNHNLFADEVDESYQFEITPYLWAAKLTGSTAVEGSQSPPIDTGYNFFALDNLDGMASFVFALKKDHWGFLFDFLYVAFEDDFLVSTPLESSPRLEGTVVEFAGTYTPIPNSNLDFIGGFRQQNIEVSLKLLTRITTANVKWIDPFVGAIYYLPLNDKFSMTLRSDLGGFGIESDIAVNIEAVIRYQFTDMFSAKLGYRYLKVKFDEDNFVYDFGLNGFQFGLGIQF